MSAVKLCIAATIAIAFVHARPAPGPQGPTPAVIQKNEGERRIRRPRTTAIASSTFVIKVSPQVNGSKHLLVGYEEVPPGAMIPKHKHHGEEEILLLQTGTAHVWLGEKEFDAQPGAIVFIPPETSISLKNTGTDNINLTFVFNEPGFEEMLRCASVAYGAAAPPMSQQDVVACYQHGDAELAPVAAR